MRQEQSHVGEPVRLLGRALRLVSRVTQSEDHRSVSYTHLTLPTIYSV